MRRRCFLPAALLTLSLAVAPFALAQRQAPETFSGKVVAVMDGDTIGGWRNGRERTRLDLEEAGGLALYGRREHAERQFARQCSLST